MLIPIKKYKVIVFVCCLKFSLWEIDNILKLYNENELSIYQIKNDKGNNHHSQLLNRYRLSIKIQKPL